MKIGWIAFTFLSWLLIPLQIGSADMDQEIHFSRVVIDYQFNQEVTFEAFVEPSANVPLIEEITIQIQPEGEEIQTGVVTLEDNGRLHFTYELSENKWHPFITVNFHFKTTYTDGVEETSDPYSFIYEDNRYRWQSLKQAPFDVHFQEGDLENGQMILNIALAGLQKTQNYMQNVSSSPIQLYAYTDPSDLQSAIPNHHQDWTAGYTHPSLNIIMVSAAPGPGIQLELERQIPHEIAHVLINGLNNGNHQSIPMWFSEGLATLSEIYPNPDNQRLLGFAVETDSIIPIESLCLAFPPDVDEAYLAYAESGSFVNFLFRRYGTAGLGTLLQQYSNGVSCEMGIITLTGESLFTIEQQWHQQVLGMDTRKVGIDNLIPYMTFLVIIMIPLCSTVFFRE